MNNEDASKPAIKSMQMISGLRLHCALGLLVLVNIFNYADRYFLAMLIEPIRTDLGMTDGQVGLLTGAAFAVAYATMVIPIGRLADRISRVRIITTCLVGWSACTALFGMAGNFLHLLLARIGVAACEAGAYSPVQSLIGDYYPAHKRGTALAILSVGSFIGIAAGYAIAGYLNDLYGWQHTFIAVGLAGIMLGPLIFFTLPEPLRGLADGLTIQADKAKTSTMMALRELSSRKAFVLTLAAYAVASAASYGTFTWLPTFFIRKFDLPVSQVGFLTGMLIPIPLTIGSLAGGMVSDRLYKRDVRWGVWLPAIGLVIAAPFAWLQIFTPVREIAFLATAIPAFIGGVYVVPLMALLLALSGSRLRATGASLMAFAVILVGQGIGPSLIGLLSDLFSSNATGNSHLSLTYALATLISLYFVGAAIMIMAGRHIQAGITASRRYDLDASAA